MRVIPVTSHTNDDTFTKKMSEADQRSLRTQNTLPQNDLARAPFLDAMMELSALSLAN